MSRDLLLLIEDSHAQTGVALEKSEARRQANDSGADNNGVPA